LFFFFVQKPENALLSGHIGNQLQSIQQTLYRLQEGQDDHEIEITAVNAKIKNIQHEQVIIKEKVDSLDFVDTSNVNLVHLLSYDYRNCYVNLAGA
jgi:hypothetical protein